MEKGKECKCKRMLGALKFAAGGSSFDIKKRLAEAIIMSRIVHGIQLWGPGSSSMVLKRMQTMQNLAMCWITGKHRLTRTETWLRELNLS